jgi:hypothetical protein
MLLTSLFTLGVEQLLEIVDVLCCGYGAIVPELSRLDVRFLKDITHCGSCAQW